MIMKLRRRRNLILVNSEHCQNEFYCQRGKILRRIAPVRSKRSVFNVAVFVLCVRTIGGI